MTNLATPASFAGKTALVVDDGMIEQLAGKSLLQKLGFTVRTAGNGVDALRLLQEQAADVVICDISMPGMSGIEVLEAARVQASTARFIMVSSHDDEEHARAALERGAAAYLVKPLRFDTLRDTIADVLAG